MFWGNWVQLLFATAMAVLAIVLVVEGVKTFILQHKEKSEWLNFKIIISFLFLIYFSIRNCRDYVLFI